jgi:glucose-1-phosphate cytidylyltransferase
MEKVVILCGGAGTRLREQTEFIPKPMVQVGGMPILWHIMKIYSHYGFDDFILCLGYKGDAVKDYFLNYKWMANDFTLNLKSRKEHVIHYDHPMEDWNITFADTGLDTNTGSRVKKIEKYLGDCDDFMVTYGDGVGDIDLRKLAVFHKKSGKIATITAVHPTSKYGIVSVENNVVTSYRQKPQLEGLINAGFFVFKQEMLDYLNRKDIPVEEPFPKLAAKKQLAAFTHEGFWHCMDTYQDYTRLNEIYKSGNVPWKVWRE